MKRRDLLKSAAFVIPAASFPAAGFETFALGQSAGPGNAALWSRLLGKEIRYMGHNFDQWEQAMRSRMPGWSAFDLRMMFRGYFDRGFASTETEVARLTKFLGHSPRSYEDVAAQTAATWIG